MAQERRRLIIDASPLASPRFSGVGHCVYGFIHALCANPDFTSRYELHLVGPARGMRYIRAHQFPGVVYRPIPLPARVWNRLPGTPLMPFMDLFLGRGVYFFTNFRAWPLLRSKSLTLIHDIAFRLHPESLTARHRSFLEANVPRWIRHSTLVATVSESSRQEIIANLKLAPERVEVLYNGVDRQDFYPRPAAEITAARAKYGLPDGYIVFISNIEPRKNIGRLVDAYLALPQQLRDTYGLVLIGGSSWLSTELDAKIAAAQAAGAQIVRPNAYVTDADLPAVISGARALAHPALHEGFGMPLLEAMACDVPVLTANNSSLPEVAGDAAVMVEATDTPAITAGLQQLLTDDALRQRLITAGRRRAAAFDWATPTAKLVTIIDRLYAEEV